MLSNRVFSEIGLSAYTREQSAFVYFRKVLNKIERELFYNNDINLNCDNEILMF